MRPILLSLALIGLAMMAFSCASHADAPPAAPTADTWTLEAPAAAPTAATIPVAACTSRSCAAPQIAARSTSTRLKAGQPLRNAGRVATAPIRTIRAAQPIRRVGAAIRSARPLRKAARAVGWLFRR